ncbi:MAG: hypothetical protein HOM11_08540 [Methylococcales bacterium]|jgi:hypothetical protein|nr:hypothetical protein [Methylococcales bacterium]MBT7442561.1 hypothetical protein [Methylococcales bacterium]
MAIADAFFSMINTTYADQRKRTYLRAAAEINANSGTQFSEDWVQAFNIVVKMNASARSHWMDL